MTALVVVLASCAATLAYDRPSDRSELRPAPASDAFSTRYQVQAGLDGEVYPFLANYASLQRASDRRFGVVAVTITNSGKNLLRQRAAVRVPGWSDQEIQAVELAPGSVQTLVFAPSFLPRFYENHEIIAATAEVSMVDLQGRPVYQTTVPIHIRSCEDIYWGEGFKYAPFIASWVTPHDPLVEIALAKAKTYTPDHRLPGYEDWKSAAEQERETYRQAKAIFTALQRMGVSYVKSSFTLGGHQSLSERVRMPQVTLRQSSMNCIDAVVTYASLFENLGMDAEVIVVPGHAYVGVRVARASSRFLLIDAALTGRSTFESAVASAQNGMARRQPSSVTQVVVEEARSAGIYPMP